MEETVLQRIRKVIDYLDISDRKFAESIGLPQTTISSMFKRGNDPKVSIIQAIINAHTFISLDWLMTGQGEMTNRPTSQGNAKLVENIQYMEVPVVHIHARCGYLTGYGDPVYIDSLPTMPVIVDKTYNGNYRVFETEGDSMDDGSRKAIFEGDKVLCREVKRDLWQYKLHYNDWYFAIVDKKDGIVIKQIIDHDVEKGIITCHSLNPLFEDYKICLDDVAELYNVIKIVERSARL